MAYGELVEVEEQKLSKELTKLFTRYKKLPDLWFTLIVQRGGLLNDNDLKNLSFCTINRSITPLDVYHKRTRQKRSFDSRHKAFLESELEVYISLDQFATYLTTGYYYAFKEYGEMEAVFSWFNKYLSDPEYTKPPTVLSMNETDLTGFVDKRIVFIDIFCQDVINIFKTELEVRAAEKVVDKLDIIDKAFTGGMTSAKVEKEKPEGKKSQVLKIRASDLVTESEYTHVNGKPDRLRYLNDPTQALVGNLIGEYKSIFERNEDGE